MTTDNTDLAGLSSSPEPTVQVPVSLIEHIRRTYSVLNLGPNVVDALDALLSQPTQETK